MPIDYDRYLEVCRNATDDDELFKGFKSNPNYTWVLEHVNYQHGLEYLEVIKSEFPNFRDYIEKFATNDDIGNPMRFWFKELGLNLSPTTLRYIKVLNDLRVIFNNLDDLNIVEIGGGYGGQCKIINDFYEPKSYTLVDLPSVLSLSKKYLQRHGIENIVLRGVTEESDIRYDLCISNYAFTELDRKFQEFYRENIIKKSDRGYITCNFVTESCLDGRFSKEEILSLRDNYKTFEERPLTAPNNFIYTWNL
jgi:putative sugar O-methyltransferase